MQNLCEFLGEPDPVELRKCIKCGEDKSLDNFGFRSYGKSGEKREQRSDCKDCGKKQSRILRQIKKDNPLINYNTHRCPHCLRSKDDIFSTGSWINSGRKHPFIPDHCHETGAFRGWVCDDCNTVIARSKEDVATLRRIADSLEGLTNTKPFDIMGTIL